MRTLLIFLYEYIDLSEEDKRCACGAEMEKIGVDVSEKIEIVPARIFVKRTEKAKYPVRAAKGILATLTRRP
jgi:transposase